MLFSARSCKSRVAVAFDVPVMVMYFLALILPSKPSSLSSSIRPKDLDLPVVELPLPQLYQLIGSGKALNVSRLEMGIGSLSGSARNNNDL